MTEHFLQSEVWQKFEEREGRQTFREKGEGFAFMAVLHKTPIGNYLYCPYGPTVKTAKGLEKALEALKRLALEHKAFFVRIEPVVPFQADELEKMGLVKSKDLDPAKTWVIDLSEGTDVVLSRIEKNRVRAWRRHDKAGITVRKTQRPEDITILTGLLNKLGEKRKFNPQDVNHLRRQLEEGFATLYIAEYEGKPISASLVHDYKDTRFAMHAAANYDYAKLRTGGILAVEAMIDAVNEGKVKFDFWGMTTSTDPKHPWYGFTQYKKSFGGKQVDYAGTWDLPIKKAKYKVYGVVRKVNRAIRKV